MKVYLLKDVDFERLLAAIDRDPVRGLRGVNRVILSGEERELHERVHRFFNYHLRQWIDSVKGVEE